MTAYSALLLVHSWLRWAVLALAVLVPARALSRGRARAAWTAGDRRLSVIFTALLDTQVLVGLGLYFGLSPVTPRSMAAFGAAMKLAPARFFAVEHLFAMIFALVAAHVGVASAKRAEQDEAKHRRLAIGVGLALLAILAGIPWPGMPYARPLFRF